MTALLRIELLKTFSKWRTYIGFIAIAVLVPVVQYAIYSAGDNYLNMVLRSIRETFIYTGNLLNGYLIGYMILQALIIHVPFLIVLVGGDILAGEATLGTYRMLLTRPVSRLQVITSKFTAGFIYTLLLLFFLAFMSLGVSLLLFGTGELIVASGKIYIFAADDVLWRFLLAYGFAILSMFTVFSLSFLFSSFVENAIGPIVATMAVIIIFFVLSALNIDFLSNIQPYLFTSYMNEWRNVFVNEVDYTGLLKSAGILLLHIAAFYSAALYFFVKKDILS